MAAKVIIAKEAWRLDRLRYLPAQPMVHYTASRPQGLPGPEQKTREPAKQTDMVTDSSGSVLGQ